MKRNDTQIAANESVLLIVDLQEGLIAHPLTVDAQKLRGTIGALLDLANLFRVPVIVSKIAPGGDELAEVLARVPDAPRFERKQTNAFRDGATRRAIKRTGRSRLLVAGIVTEIAASLPSLSAAEAGYAVSLVYDACGGESPRSEHAAFGRLAAAGVLPVSVPALIGEFITDFSKPEAQQALQLLQKITP